MSIIMKDIMIQAEAKSQQARSLQTKLFLLITSFATTTGLIRLHQYGYFNRFFLALKQTHQNHTTTQTSNKVDRAIQTDETITAADNTTQTDKTTTADATVSTSQSIENQDTKEIQTDTISTTDANNDMRTATSDIDTCGSTPKQTSPHQAALPVTENGNPRLFTTSQQTETSANTIESWLPWPFK